MLLFDDDLLDNETDVIKSDGKRSIIYVSCLWVLKYSYFVVVVSSALGAVCRDLGRCSWSTAFAGGLFAGSNPAPTFFDFRRSSWNYVTRQHFTGRGGGVEGSWSRPSNFLH